MLCPPTRDWRAKPLYVLGNWDQSVYPGQLRQPQSTHAATVVGRPTADRQSNAEVSADRRMWRSFSSNAADLAPGGPSAPEPVNQQSSAEASVRASDPTAASSTGRPAWADIEDDDEGPLFFYQASNQSACPEAVADQQSNAEVSVGAAPSAALSAGGRPLQADVVGRPEPTADEQINGETPLGTLDPARFNVNL